MKRAAVDYYRKVARWMLPHLKNRPISIKRYPGPIGGLAFWEKDAPAFTPTWVRTTEVPRRSDGTTIHYIVVDNVKTLTWIAGVGGIEIHPFLHRAPRLDEATAVVFDLDPGEGATFAQCCDVALILRHALASLKLEAFAKVSGSKGLQVYVPLNSGAAHAATEAFAKIVAEELARAHPSLVVAEMAKTLRRKKVFIDWSQNADYKTTVAVYSLRATGRVSMPVTWEEVEGRERLDFRIAEALARVRKRGDLFAPVLTMTQQLPLSVSPARGQARVPVLHRQRSQSGRHRFVKTKTELRLEVGGIFKIRDKLEDRGTYEIIDYDDARYDLWFSGATMQGRWLLEKAGPSWSLTPTA
jgi:bifunctional non-homologous end joining protein LigD